MLAEITKWLLVALLALNAIGVILSVGKERPVYTNASAVFVTLINASIIVAVLSFWES